MKHIQLTQTNLITFPFLFLETCLLLNKLTALYFLSKVTGARKRKRKWLCPFSWHMPSPSQKRTNHWIKKNIYRENYQIKNHSPNLSDQMILHKVKSSVVSTRVYQASLLILKAVIQNTFSCLFSLFFFLPYISQDFLNFILS